MPMSCADRQRLPFVDAHHHLWDVDVHPYPGLADLASRLARHYLLDDFLADASDWRPIKSVHVQGEIDRARSLDESAWLQRIADTRGYPHAIVAYAPLQDSRLGEILEAQARHANVRGIRQILNPDQCERPDYLTDQAWRTGYARLAEFGLSFDLQALPEQFADAAALASEHPGTPMIVNHTGMPRDQSAAGLERWRSGMRLLASQPHVSVKISGFGMFDAEWTTERIRPLVVETIEMFGIDRCMLGSNFPVDRLWTTYTRLLDALNDIMSGLTESGRHKLFHANAERVYRI
jgi:predicted TIM-barrel fold metal-dependent hydrolase